MQDHCRPYKRRLICLVDIAKPNFLSVRTDRARLQHGKRYNGHHCHTGRDCSTRFSDTFKQHFHIKENREFREESTYSSSAFRVRIPNAETQMPNFKPPV